MFAKQLNETITLIIFTVVNYESIFVVHTLKHVFIHLQLSLIFFWTKTSYACPQA